MKLSQFNYFLPENLIADHPLEFKDQERLMVVNRESGEIEHKSMKDLIDYFDEGDVMVFNNVKVFPAVLKGKKEKNDSDIQVFLLRELKPEQNLWEVMVSPARKIRIGNKIQFAEGLIGEIKDNTESSGRTIKFIYDGSYEELKKLLKKIGEIPLPPYIQRNPTNKDRNYFNHPLAKHESAVVSPTAILHFDKLMLKRLEVKGIKFTDLTLFPGVFNFDDIAVEDLSKHKMGSEAMFISEDTANLINEAKNNRKKICAIGTTVVKALETAATPKAFIDPYEGWTSKFIFPPYEIKTINALVSNFHLPKTPMLMTVAAFGGYNLIMKAYQEAVKNKYRFGIFGDAMLII